MFFSMMIEELKMKADRGAFVGGSVNFSVLKKHFNFRNKD